jgi:hypothetical protein
VAASPKATAISSDSLFETILRNAQGKIPREALVMAFEELKQKTSTYEKRDVMTIVNFAQPDTEKRFHVINLKTGEVESFFSSHGSGRGSQGHGAPLEFSNQPKSNLSSLGFKKTSRHAHYGDVVGYGLSLHGKEEGLNLNDSGRGIMIHAGGNYNRANRAGLSQGCHALDSKENRRVVDTLAGGSLFFAYHPQQYRGRGIDYLRAREGSTLLASSR